jgi:hypothetical protein
MLTPLALIIIVKSKSSLALAAVALINYATAGRES